MKKEKITIKAQKPTNSAVLQLVACKGGAHEKSFKAKRKKDKQALRSENFTSYFLLENDKECFGK